MEKSQTRDVPPGPGEARPGESRASCLFRVLAAHRPLLAPARYPLGEVEAVHLGRGETGATLTREGGRYHLHLAVEDPFMSSAHARLVRALGRWVLEDSGSRNGTRVNGQRVERVLLADGDVLECGQTFFRYRTGVPAAPSVEEPPPEVAEAFATLWPPLAWEFAALRRVAASPLLVLLLGESGTGKEVLARAVHALSGRSGPLLGINCGALPASLVASELFGHRKGAFSGAVEDRPGLVRSADGGTLLLDEIGDMPAAEQPTLLRVLEQHEVLPVGGTRPVPVDLRVLSATHQDLEALVGQGRFRADLYARLAGHVLRLPPLRERREDVGLLVGALLRRIAGERAERLTLARETARVLLRHTWPLNVRELRRCLERAVLLCGEGPLLPEHLPEGVRGSTAGGPESPPTPPVAPPESEAGRPSAESLEALLSAHQGNLSAVARALGKDRTQVRRWLKHYQLSPERFRSQVG